MSLPTVGETYAQLMEHLRKAEEHSAMLAHLVRDDRRDLALSWLKVSEQFKKLQHTLTQLAMGRLQ